LTILFIAFAKNFLTDQKNTKQNPSTVFRLLAPAAFNQFQGLVAAPHLQASLEAAFIPQGCTSAANASPSGGRGREYR
jgi:hypothetical protein